MPILMHEFVSYCISSNGGVWYELYGWVPYDDVEVTKVGLDDMVELNRNCLNVHYATLESENEKRGTIRLCRAKLEESVEVLSQYNGGSEIKYLKVHLLRITQMFPEAIRIPRIFMTIARGFDVETGIQLSQKLVLMENNYSKLCVEFMRKLLEENTKGEASNK